MVFDASSRRLVDVGYKIAVQGKPTMFRDGVVDGGSPTASNAVRQNGGVSRACPDHAASMPT